MGVGVSIFLIAVGAILTFALETAVSGIDLDVVGIILMLVGGFGLLWSAIWMSTHRDRVVVERTVEPAPDVRRPL